MKPKDTPRASTYALKGGGFLHIDRLIMPIAIPRRLTAVPPLEPSGQLKETIAEARDLKPKRKP